MCIAIVLTAARLGANIANHTEVLELNKQMSDGKQVLSGARVKDRLTGMVFLSTADALVQQFELIVWLSGLLGRRIT